jgi:hypothetical protein
MRTGLLIDPIDPDLSYMDAPTGIGFEGDLIIEFQGGGNREEAVVQSRGYLKRLLQGGIGD